MNNKFKFASKFSSEILGAGLADAINSALTAGGRTIDLTQVQVANKDQELDGFGKNVFTAQSPALVVGMQYAIVACLKVPASVNSRGTAISGYDAVALRDANGATHVVSLTALFNPWQPLVDEKNKIIDINDLSEGLAKQYEDAPEQLAKMANFIKLNNKESIANSFASGFTSTSSFAERFEKLNGKIITIEASEEAKVKLTLTSNAGPDMEGTVRQAVVRAYALSTDGTANGIKAFESKIKASKK